MNLYLKIILILNLIIPVTLVQAQLFNHQDILKGKIIDDSTGKHISFVQILNESKRKWYICDNEGNFSLQATAGDTLALSALGYLGKVIILNDSDIQDGLTIALSPRVYEIYDVKVFGFRSYSEFKEEFKNLKLPETKTSDGFTASYEPVTNGESGRLISNSYKVPSSPVT